MAGAGRLGPPAGRPDVLRALHGAAAKTCFTGTFHESDQFPMGLPQHPAGFLPADMALLGAQVGVVPLELIPLIAKGRKRDRPPGLAVGVPTEKQGRSSGRGAQPRP